MYILQILSNRARASIDSDASWLFYASYISVAVRKAKARIRLVHFTPVVDKMLCTKNRGAQISMV